ncbi:9123_t:CDS:2 [Funneliformis mosseae]|uniref:9123_t:CDS:1 n=1 Tax=Funneliformis mosseae TaxID=27381 RepID=A0A9N9C3G0_FUNMO|nr:9123_t:CDS:2 [Funneliformis mosseae]
MFTSEYETSSSFLSLRQSSLASALNSSLSTLSNPNADELALQEWNCNHNRIANRDHETTHNEFARQFFAFSNFPPQDQVNYGSTTCYATPDLGGRGSHKQSDASFVPNLLPIPAQNPCETEYYPKDHTTQFWLSPNRVEDVIVLKLWKWNRTYNNRIPSRRLTNRTIPQDSDGNYQPVQIIEFGTIDAKNRLYNGCSAPGMRTLSISPHCIYRGCPRQDPPRPPYPISNDVIIDLFHIQQQVFRVIRRFIN